MEKMGVKRSNDIEEDEDDEMEAAQRYEKMMVNVTEPDDHC